MCPGPFGATRITLTFFGREIRRDVLLICLRLFGVRNGDENNIGTLHRFTGGVNFKTFFLRDRNRLAALVKADDHLATALLKVERMGMALGAEAENGEGFIL
jgi:hypothetical protein